MSKASSANLSKQQQPKILVVDDQPINIKLLQRKLERQGMNVYVAYNGRECLDLVTKVTPDLILLDIMMPDMDGIETCQRLKSNPETEAVPIIFITAKASKEGKLEGLDAGAVDYITKPIDLDETIARVRTQLRLQDVFRENLKLQERLADARKAAAVGAITQGITHNLNNLLGVVVGYLDLMKNGHDRPDMVKRSIGLMDNAINRMVNIVRQLGTIANHERFELSSLEIIDLLEGSIERFKKECEAVVTIEREFNIAQDARISANAETFESLVGQLLSNAWDSYKKNTPPENRNITLRASIRRDQGPSLLELQIMDQGEGIAPEVQEHLFEPFITTKTAVGRGMGLTIARHTLRNLGGELRVTENPGRGVTATMIHPL